MRNSAMVFLSGIELATLWWTLPVGHSSPHTLGTHQTAVSNLQRGTHRDATRVKLVNQIGRPFLGKSSIQGSACLI